MDERKAFEHIESATVLKPGDRVLLTVNHHWSREELDEAADVLKERFPEAEFTWLTGVESVTIKPSGLVEENTDD